MINVFIGIVGAICLAFVLIMAYLGNNSSESTKKNMNEYNREAGESRNIWEQKDEAEKMLRQDKRLR